LPASALASWGPRQGRGRRSRNIGPGDPWPLPLLRPPTIIGADSFSQLVMTMPGTSSWQLRDSEHIIACNTGLLGQKHFLIGITRIRNEALVLEDTLNFVGQQVDAIVAYDDASTDRTLEILAGHPKVALIVANRSWETDVEARRLAEGRHRGLLLQTAREHLQFDWMFCFDPDERVTGDLRGFVERTHSSGHDGVRVQLFDAYMTPDDQAPYRGHRELLGFRRFYGPERRDILMFSRNRPEIIFAKREPDGLQSVTTALYCQHYGKSLSVEHWEETCDYYIRHFPFETYGRKWLQRKGQAIHTQSDFARPLYEWGDTLFANAVKM
jgi:glycosyltransferase involved in cell wall biosynthesis